ncbi:MAG TPA: UDP-N-acetylglucosamine 2-epimerase (non-hydrolyzing) [Terriglobales bacterium]|jgi:UDP-N-acetylglucosamine 2-epimerase (non-hydrolysing)|nr:UDP-N-acetylglucosamine 2-epimerase (non-hydrolyzing) [Terriglobales bacterium]
MKCRIIAVLGTRPEAIKLALVIHALRQRSEEFETAVVHTGQHRTMLDHALQYFKIKPDFDLDVMRPNQTLNSLTGRVLDTVENACHRFQPNMVLVQGDTTTAFASALAAYYCKIAVGHIEAGLRSHDIYNPFPEEANRRLASVLTEIHFAPTALSRDNLLAEGVPDEKIVVTGNTVIDTLRALSTLPHSWENTPLAGIPDDNSRLVLVTSHRRESLGLDQENMCLALKDLVKQHPDIRVIYPVHMNPNVRSTVNALLQNTDRIHLTEPLDYITFVSLLRRCFLVLTDSGGIQEEAPTFGKPVLVLRKLTERPEASQFGMAKIIGMSREGIVNETSHLLNDAEAYQDMSEGENPYGDGHSSERIVEAVARWYQKKTPLLEATKQFKLAPRPQPRRRKSDAEESARKAAAAGKE